MLPFELVADELHSAARSDRQMVAGFAYIAETAFETLRVRGNDRRDDGVPAKHLRQYADLVATTVQQYKDSSVG